LVSRAGHPGQKGRQSALAFAFYAFALTIGFLPDFFSFLDTPIMTYQPCGSLAFQSSRVVATPIVSRKQAVRRVLNTCVLLNSNVHIFVASSDQVVTIVLLFNTIIIEWDEL
jgi:hypothetical protein